MKYIYIMCYSILVVTLWVWSAPPTCLQTGAATACGAVRVFAEPVHQMFGMTAVTTTQAQVRTPFNNNKMHRYVHLIE